jgi:hypothetical protein
MPRKIIFCHFGKAAGVWVNEYLKAMLRRRGYVIRDSWELGLERDWSPLELSQIRRLDLDLLYVHQHHINLKQQDIAAFRNAGFYTMTFLRHPGDIICSLYFWARRLVDEGKGNPFAGHFDITNATLDEWAQHCLGPARQLWALPVWTDDLHHAEEYCEANFAAFIDRHFGQAYDPTALPFERRNSSANKGWANHVASGEICETTRREIVNDIDFRKYAGRVKM